MDDDGDDSRQDAGGCGGGGGDSDDGRGGGLILCRDLLLAGISNPFAYPALRASPGRGVILRSEETEPYAVAKMHTATWGPLQGLELGRSRWGQTRGSRP